MSKPQSTDSDTARLASTQVGKLYAGWFTFQPLYDKILREEPDFLE